MPAAKYIWIRRWPDFQHYVPKSDQAPKWIKSTTRQLLDDEYRQLPIGTRLLLHELRLAFALVRHRLNFDRRQLSLLLGHGVRMQQLEALNQAGFIEFVSRELLERRLEKLYSGSRAEVELEVEEEIDHSLRDVDLGVNGGPPPLDDGLLYPTPTQRRWSE